jgi:hypothetical protein
MALRLILAGYRPEPRFAGEAFRDTVTGYRHGSRQLLCNFGIA